MKNKIILIICIIILAIDLIILGLIIPNHILEIKTMQECANTLGCMYCLPVFVALGPIVYFISFFVIIITSIVLGYTIKKIKSQKRNDEKIMI